MPIPIRPEKADGSTPVPAEAVTAAPAQSPAAVPYTAGPTEELTEGPAEEPTAEPAEAPTDAVASAPTEAVTAAPAAPTPAPTTLPTLPPTAAPTLPPTAAPTLPPTAAPTLPPTAEPTVQPSDIPSERPTETPTEAPTGSPEPGGDGSITFSESASLPLPSLNEDIPYGQPFCFGGVVRSNDPIVAVTAAVVPSSGNTVSATVSFPASEHRTSVELVDRTFPTSGDASLTAKLRFENLAAGTYTFKLYASTTACTGALLISRQFRIVRSEWIQLISNNLRNNYAAALSFFGSRDQFMFRYKWADGRNITVEQSWLNSHFTSVTSPAGKTWYVHKKAQAGFSSAINYMSTSYVRVHGAYDSGVVRLWDLVSTFDGILNTRFVTDRTFVSHHSFGAAIDLNASMEANRNVLSNRALIQGEVRNHLAYNGIKTANGVSYYDFTYNGSCSATYRNVPQTVINYLLYELAFYRAGFGWGYYYDHACDGMHFTLSEMSASIHDTSGRSLRKVYQYIG